MAQSKGLVLSCWERDEGEEAGGTQYHRPQPLSSCPTSFILERRSLPWASGRRKSSPIVSSSAGRVPRGAVAVLAGRRAARDDVLGARSERDAHCFSVQYPSHGWGGMGTAKLTEKSQETRAPQDRHSLNPLASASEGAGLFWGCLQSPVWYGKGRREAPIQAAGSGGRVGVRSPRRMGQRLPPLQPHCPRTAAGKQQKPPTVWYEGGGGCQEYAWVPLQRQTHPLRGVITTGMLGAFHTRDAKPVPSTGDSPGT